MKIVVKRDACVGIGACVALASKTFELDDQAIAVIPNMTPKKEGNNDVYEIPGDHHLDALEDIILSAESCPVTAIFVYDDSGKQVYPRL